jgi:hypothetical protein
MVLREQATPPTSALFGESLPFRQSNVPQTTEGFNAGETPSCSGLPPLYPAPLMTEIFPMQPMTRFVYVSYINIMPLGKFGHPRVVHPPVY